MADPLRSGAIFKIKNVDALRSPMPLVATQQQQSSASNGNSTPASRSIGSAKRFINSATPRTTSQHTTFADSSSISSSPYSPALSAAHRGSQGGFTTPGMRRTAVHTSAVASSQSPATGSVTRLLPAPATARQHDLGQSPVIRPTSRSFGRLGNTSDHLDRLVRSSPLPKTLRDALGSSASFQSPVSKVGQARQTTTVSASSPSIGPSAASSSPRAGAFSRPTAVVHQAAHSVSGTSFRRPAPRNASGAATSSLVAAPSPRLVGPQTATPLHPVAHEETHQSFIQQGRAIDAPSHSSADASTQLAQDSHAVPSPPRTRRRSSERLRGQSTSGSERSRSPSQDRHSESARPTRPDGAESERQRQLTKKASTDIGDGHDHTARKQADGANAIASTADFSDDDAIADETPSAEAQPDLHVEPNLDDLEPTEDTQGANVSANNSHPTSSQQKRKRKSSNLGTGRRRSSTAASAAKTSQTPKAGSKPSNVLHGWWIKLTDAGFLVEGYTEPNQGGDIWHSSTIVKRSSHRLVATKSGSLYELVGPFDEQMSVEDGGCSPEVAAAFAKELDGEGGFPFRWKSLLADALSYSANKVPRSTRKDDKVGTSASTDEPDVPTIAAEPVPPAPRKAAASSRTGSFKSKRGHTTPRSSITADLDVNSMPRSRTGRRIKPVAEYWKGTRYVTDGFGNLRAVEVGHEPDKHRTPRRQSTGKQSKRGSAKKKNHDDRSQLQPGSARPRKNKQHVTEVDSEHDLSMSASLSSNSDEDAEEDAEHGAQQDSDLHADSSTRHTDQVRQSSSSSSNQVASLPKDPFGGTNPQPAGLSSRQDSGSSDEDDHDDVHIQVAAKLQSTSSKTPAESRSPTRPPRHKRRNVLYDGESEFESEEDMAGKPDDPSDDQTSATEEANAGSTNRRSAQLQRAPQQGTAASSGCHVSNDDHEKSFADELLQPDKDEGLSAYEQMREKRMRQNKAKLTELGLVSGGASVASRVRTRRSAQNNAQAIQGPGQDVAKETSNKSQSAMASEETDHSTKAENAIETSEGRTSQTDNGKDAVPTSNIVLVGEEMSDSDDDFEPSKRRKLNSKAHTRRENGNGKSSRALNADGLNVADSASDDWQPSELEALRRAVLSDKSNRTTSKGFWDRVARRVGTRTAAECCQRYMEPTKQRSRVRIGRKKATHAMSDSDSDQEDSQEAKRPLITAREGTIARRKQVRDALAHRDKHHVDDIFAKDTPAAGNEKGDGADVSGNIFASKSFIPTSMPDFSESEESRRASMADTSLMAEAELSFQSPGLLRSKPDPRTMDGYLAKAVAAMKKHKRKYPDRQTNAGASTVRRSPRTARKSTGTDVDALKDRLQDLERQQEEEEAEATMDVEQDEDEASDVEA